MTEQNLQNETLVSSKKNTYIYKNERNKTKKCEQFLRVHKVQETKSLSLSDSSTTHLKVQETKSLNLFGGFTTLVRVHFVGIAGTGSGGISDTESEEVQVAGPGKFGLFPFGSGVATSATGCSLGTSEGTFWAVLDADCSLGLRKCLFRRMLSLPVFIR